MPFPLEEKYIIETESELNVKFPTEFKTRMMKLNGGELIIDEFGFELYPFFDKSSRKRISRTCNHIGLETKNKRKADYGFPKNAVTIGSDGSGNQIILMHNGNNVLEDTIYFWNCKTGKIKKVGTSINSLKED